MSEVSAGLAGLAGALTACSVTTLSPTSFMVVGALVAVALTYLAGVTSVGGALLAGALAQGGLVTALGHDAPAVSTPTFQVTFTRGAEWAATGQVTLPLPADLR